MLTVERKLNFILTNGKEIHAEILDRVSSAQDSIKVAVAWFTDKDLFQALLTAQERGVKVEVVVADNENNEKLPLEEVERRDGRLVRIKGAGFGMMHQKYCIVDERIVINGSFNWTVNAKTNNSENAIVTTEKTIVQALLKNFTELTTQRVYQEERRELHSANDEFETERPDEVAFIEYLDGLVTKLIDDFDHKELFDEGYEESKKSNGNPNLFRPLLDKSVNDFRTSIDQDKHRKSNFVSRLDAAWHEREAEIKGQFERSKSLKTDLANREKESINENIYLLSEQQKQIEKKVQEHDNSKRSIKFDVEKKNEKIRQLKGDVPLRSFKMQTTWYFFALAAFFLVYLFIFYSSAAYTLQFSHEEALSALRMGLEIQKVDFFNPNAIWLIIEKGFGEVIFAFLFFLIPTALVNIKFFNDKKWIEIVFSWIIAVLLVDTFVAASISKTIYEVESLKTGVETEWTLGKVVFSLDFIKVFVFGAIPLVIFKFIATKLRSLYLNSSLEHQNIKVKAEVDSIKGYIHSKEQEINEIDLSLKHENDDLKKHKDSIIELKNVLKETAESLDQEINELTDFYEEKVTRNKRIYDIYHSNVSSSTSNFAIDSIKARVNSILQGWNSYLSEYNSESQVNQRSNEVSLEYTNWLNKISS